MDTTAETVYPTPRNPRACEACRQSKSRCYSSSEPNICQRCIKFHTTCVVRATARPRRSKKAAAIHTDHTLKSSNKEAPQEESDSSGTYIKLPTLPLLNNSKSVAALGDHHREKFKQLFLPDEMDQLFALTGDVDYPSMVQEAQSSIDAVDKVQRCLTIKEAEALLVTFRDMASIFPFVVIPEHETVKSLSQNSPFLLLAILAAASAHDIQLHHALDHELRRILSSEVMMNGKKSMDFLQGVLVYTSWYPCHLHPRNRQAFMFVNVAISMAIDLGLDKRYPTPSFSLNNDIDTRGLLDGDGYSKAAKRAYLGCYYLSSSISVSFQKPNGLKYSELIEEYGISLSTEAEHMSDFALFPLIRAHHIEEKIRCCLDKNVSQLQAEAQIQVFIQEVEEWRICTLSDVKAMPHVALAERFLAVSLYSYDFGLFQRASGTERYLNSQNLTKCLDSCRRFFELLLSVPIKQYLKFSNVQWGYMVQSIIILSRLSFPIPNCPGWDVQAARERAPLSMYLDCLCYRMQGLSAANKDDGIPKQPDEAFIFKMVLESIIKKYNERTEVMNRAISNGIHGLGGATGLKIMREQCPMRDPELTPILESMASTPSTYGSSTKGSSNSASVPPYFDLWKTMTMSWGSD